MLRCGYGSVLFFWMFRLPRMPLVVGVSLENNRRFGKPAPASAAADGGFEKAQANGSLVSSSSSSKSASVVSAVSVLLAVLELDAAAELN